MYGIKAPSTRCKICGHLIKITNHVEPRANIMLHDDFKNADMTYFRALSQYLDHHIT
jgi:hypothetical protein